MNTTQRTTLSEHGIHLWRFPLIAARQEMTALIHWLSEREKASLERMRSHRLRDKRIVAWGRLRYILSRYLDCAPGDIQLSREGAGRPEIVALDSAGLRFNLSHSGSLGLAGVSWNAIGVDIEKVDASLDVERVAARFFAPSEVAHIRNLAQDEKIEAFFLLWVLKEAHLKAYGARVPAGLSQCEIVLDPDGPRLSGTGADSPGSQHVLIEIPVSKGYAAALAGQQTKADISVFDL